MFKDVLRHMDLAQFPVVSLVLFVTVFTLVIAAAALRSPERDARDNALPLDDAQPPHSHGEG